MLDTTGSRELLDRIERSNMFLIPLDGGGEWFRYHHLFQGVLQRQLAPRRRRSARRAARARRGVARGHGRYDEAIRHWLAAGEPARADVIVAADWNAYLQRGRVVTARAGSTGSPRNSCWRIRS